MNEITNQRLGQILDQAAEQLKTLMHERVDDIQRAWNETIEEAHENEKESLPALKIGLGVSVDLEDDSVESVIRFSCAYTSRVSSKLADPDQMELPVV